LSLLPPWLHLSLDCMLQLSSPYNSSNRALHSIVNIAIDS